MLKTLQNLSEQPPHLVIISVQLVRVYQLTERLIITILHLERDGEEVDTHLDGDQKRGRLSKVNYYESVLIPKRRENMTTCTLWSESCIKSRHHVTLQSKQTQGKGHSVTVLLGTTSQEPSTCTASVNFGILEFVTCELLHVQH